MVILSLVRVRLAAESSIGHLAKLDIIRDHLVMRSSCVVARSSIEVKSTVTLFLMLVLEVTCEFILAGETVGTTVFASDGKAGEDALLEKFVGFELSPEATPTFQRQLDSRCAHIRICHSRGSGLSHGLLLFPNNERSLEPAF